MQNQRQTSAQRGYGYRWQKAREGFLRNHPLCADCARRGITQAADVVDHITPHRGDMNMFWDRDNWQALCANCHNSFKQRLEKSGVEAGCNIDGVPIDKNHHWNL